MTDLINGDSSSLNQGLCTAADTVSSNNESSGCPPFWRFLPTP